MPVLPIVLLAPWLTITLGMDYIGHCHKLKVHLTQKPYASPKFCKNPHYYHFPSNLQSNKTWRGKYKMVSHRELITQLRLWWYLNHQRQWGFVVISVLWSIPSWTSTCIKWGSTIYQTRFFRSLSPARIGRRDATVHGHKHSQRVI